MEEEKITILIEKTYTKKEAFDRFVSLHGRQTATEAYNADSEYRKLMEFLNLEYLIS